MSNSFSIEAYYRQKFSPKEIFQLFLNNGWQAGGNEDSVFYIGAKDKVENSQFIEKTDFSIDDFLNSHDQNDPIVISLGQGDFFGTFSFYDTYLGIGLDYEIYVDEERIIPDFTWYLKQLSFFFRYAGVRRYICEMY